MEKETPEHKHHEHAHAEHKEDEKLYTIRDVKPTHHTHHSDITAKKQEDKKSIKVANIITILGIVVGIILLINIIISSITINTLTEKLDEAKDLSKPVEINLYAIKDQRCTNCFDVSSVVELVKKSNVKIKNEETIDLSSQKAKELIEKYSINKIPTVIVQGNTSRLALQGFEIKTDALVFNQLRPPYIEPISGKIKGSVSIIKLRDSSCGECSDIDLLVSQLRQNNIIISTEKNVDIASDEGMGLLDKYKIKKVPTMILSEDAKEYDLIKSAWPQLGHVADDGSYILTTINPPYKDIQSNEVMGLVELTYLTDLSCKTCYNVSEHKAIIANPQGFNVHLKKEIYVDISEDKGKELVNKYNITLAPTIILSKDASAYQGLLAVWRNVGTIEKDGSFVFRNLAVMQSAYKDLAKNEVVTPSIGAEG